MHIFKNNGLSVAGKTNLKTGDFLGINSDLIKGVYQPYKIPNDGPLCINKKFKDPPSILQQLPK